MSREFAGGVNERITCAPGGLASFSGAPGTIMCLWRPLATTDQGLITGRKTGAMVWDVDPASVGPFVRLGLLGIPNIANSTPSVYAVADGWRIDAWTKDNSGATTPRWHVFRYSVGIWGHTNKNGPFAPAANTTDEIYLGALDSTKVLTGRIGAIAVYSAVLSDSDIGTTGIQTDLQSWMDLSPIACWKFNTNDVATGAVDITGNGANETSHSATSFSADEPSPFDYTVASSRTADFLPFFA